MLIGAMNHPARDPVTEVRHFAAQGFDFIDLTLEPPGAATWKVNMPELKRALAETGLHVVGHTAYYLPLASPFASLRRAAVQELRHCIEMFAEVGTRWVNLHPDGHAPFHDWSFVIDRNIESLNELLPTARACDIGLMVENLPGKFNSVEQLALLLDRLPEVGLHLDIGHANLQVERNTTEHLLEAYGSRLRHVHLHDNKGGWADLHLPLGSGSLDTRHLVRALKASGYDATVTLEVFSADPHFLLYSRDQLRRWWDEAPAAAGATTPKQPLVEVSRM